MSKQATGMEADAAGRRSGRLWLFEYVGLDVWTTAILLWAWWTGETVRYAQVSARANNLWRRLFPARQFDELESQYSQQASTHFEIYRLIEKRSIEIERAPLFQALERFLPHPKLGPVVRKALIADGFMQLLLSLEAEQRQAEGQLVSFLPKERRPYLLKHYSSAAQTIPAPWRFILFIQALSNHLLCPLRYGAGVPWIMLRNGVAWRLPPPQQWAISQMVLGDVSPSSLMTDEIIYGEGSLAPNKILHVLQGRPSAGYLDYARSKGLPVVDVQQLRSTSGFIWARVLCGYLPSLARQALWDGIFHRTAADIVLAILRIGLYVLENERLALHHHSRVWFGWDAYWVRADVRAMVWDRLGGCYVGYVHGVLDHPSYSYHNTYMPVLLLPGIGMRDMLGETLQHIPEIAFIGFMKTEFTPDEIAKAQRLRVNEPSAHIVVAFDSSYSPLGGLTEKVYEKFFMGLLDLLEDQPHILLYLKLKYRHQDQPAYTRMAARFEQHRRVHVTYDDTYHLLAAADSVVVIGGSTVGWEALACRKPAFFFDPRDCYREKPAWKYSPPLVCHTADELLQNYRCLLRGQYLDPAAWNRIVSYEARFAEERPLTAVRQLLLDKAGTELA